MKKLWSTRETFDQKIEKFTIGNDLVYDQELAPYDVVGSIAHCQMLHSVGLLNDKEWHDLRTELVSLYQLYQKGEIHFSPGIEDIHSQVEFILTEKLGVIGKKIHTGKIQKMTRCCLDLKLFYRDQIYFITNQLTELFHLLIELSDKNKDCLLPGYTHLQVAMPSSFGLWYGAYAENLIDDLRIWNACFDVINQCPLGSGAGYGSAFQLDRGLTSHLLGFPVLNYNVVHAQMQRGRGEMILSYAIASTAQNLSRFACDVCLYANQDFGFIELPDHLTTGSSIMPHKKNPDVFELLAGKCNMLQNLPGQIHALLINLPSGYHRDLQLLKDSIFPALLTTQQCLDI